MDVGYSIPDDLARLIVEGERIVWVGRSVLKPFILRNLTGLPVLIIFLFIPIPFISVFSSSPLPISMNLFPIIFLLIWYSAIGFYIFGLSLYPILLWRNLYYVLTDRRIIVRKGVVGIDYDILDLEYVQQVNLDRGVWDRLYGTGTIIVQAIGVKPIEIRSIPDPFRSVDTLRKTVEYVRSSKTPRV
ncbi:MAG: PH domain-containing protein [Nitrososphaerota archaeon]|nr:PH domain-containing protein [Candidatus Bathyarchaeota archaeon]MDW8062509.1 PH domain-containing protein [Nitrososphaerota archaeon]